MALVIGVCMGNRNFSDKIRQLRRLSKFGFGPGSEVGFENQLLFFGLLDSSSERDPKQVRHTLGFAHPDPFHQNIP